MGTRLMAILDCMVLYCYLSYRLHKCTYPCIQIGRVSYQSRFLQSQSYKKNMAANRIVVSEFGTVAYPDPCKTIFHRYVQRNVLQPQYSINYETSV